ncbi:MAG: YceI family protein [Pseudonocardiales bacterium]|nr:YceI family protein [Pseudonocardiales bacterium]
MNGARILALVLVAALPSAFTGAQQPAATETRTAASFDGLDSVVYHLAPSSRLQVKTGKAGLFGFAGHSHLIRARAFTGRVVYYPKAPAESHLEITVDAESLEVLTPPDTAEIRKVTATMRSDILHVEQYREIRLVSRRVTPKSGGFRLIGALTLVGQTREVPIEIEADPRPDTLRAAGTFSVKQSDFGIKPFSGGPAGTVKVADRVKFDIAVIAGSGAPDTIGAGTRR